MSVGKSLGVIFMFSLVLSCSIFSPISQESSIQRGREIWFKSTYGGQKFFAFLVNHPDLATVLRSASGTSSIRHATSAFRLGGRSTTPTARQIQRAGLIAAEILTPPV